MLKLDRATLAKLFQGNQQAILTFERMIGAVGDTLPSTIEEANALAGQALALVQTQGALLSLVAQALAQLEGAPRPHLGTIVSQNHDSVEITGGTAGLDAGTAAAPGLYFGGERITGAYLAGVGMLGLAAAGSQRAYIDATGIGVWGNVSASGQLMSNAGPGTPPLSVVSTTRVANLNVDRAALADEANMLTAPTTYPADATDLPSAITLVNALKAAAISKGL